MAKIDDLIAQIPDEGIKKAVRAELRELKKTKKFGLVFEEHLPETVRLPNLPVKDGELVAKKSAAANELWRVAAIQNGIAALERANEGREPRSEIAKIEAPVAELVVVRSFGDPIYPAIVSLDRVARGGADKPWHTVINADNFHALELLLYAYEGQVDVIYIDPPYNSGASDWKYNNNYIDENDPWRHSKWLSMMQKRLKLAKRLLKPNDSVLIVTIDEKEYLRLGLLLEQLFPNARIQMVSINVNPAAASRAGAFGRSDEYIFFVMQGCSPARLPLEREWVSGKGRTHTGAPRWDLLRRSGSGASRADSPGCFYPIYVDVDTPEFVKVGEPLPAGKSKPPHVPGAIAILPIRKDGSEGRWMMTPGELRTRISQGRVRISVSKGGNKAVLYYLADGEYKKIEAGEFAVVGTAPDGSMIFSETDGDEIESVLAIPSTQWRISSHDSTQYGTRLLADFIPGRKFPFPKSLYAVEDTIRFFVKEKPDSLILDFFGGSGTTTHAVMRINKQDGGRRRSILVTNNELSGEEAASLRQKGLRPGDQEWEALGIFEYVTRPRLVAATTGRTPNGELIPGEYRFTDKFPMADGFAENIEFFRLDFLDPDEVARGDAFKAILPVLWMMAGCRGERENSKGAAPWFMPKQSPFAVLIQEKQFSAFRSKLSERNDIKWIFLITDSEENFAQMRRTLGRRYSCVQLYKSYLENFRINSRDALLG
ncbi:site-specific DNA-methyltransferase [Bradyrhizobium oligotrophicum]|uniref:site-specific DNA-methyltransferase n=1 Tax=Bradyrhizobium oligotrophicum TaxID=44255 RepID=UPI003EB8542E